jgi:hypothetical protein
VLEQLFLTKAQALVHIAIDLLLIFQSAQRFASDRESLRKGVIELLEKRRENHNCSSFEITISKTKQKVEVVLGDQLIRLLEEFKWVRFYRNGSLYLRMAKIFGFSLNSRPSTDFKKEKR